MVAGLVTSSHVVQTGLMTNHKVPRIITSTEVADNIKSILNERGRTLEWLAGEIGIDVQTILKAFSAKVPIWLTIDAATVLEVAPDVLVGATR